MPEPARNDSRDAAVPRKAQLFIGGAWRDGGEGGSLPILNPASEVQIGQVGVATRKDLQDALDAAERGFHTWRATNAYDRGRIMRKAVEIIRARADAIARIMTLEQGKPVAEAKGEVLTSADNMEWMAEEATRGYGRLLADRQPGVQQIVRREPIGPVASFTPWNFPVLTPLRKIAGALAAGCSLILKPAEETPLSAVEIVRAFEEAGLPAGVLNLVFGVPAQISEMLIGSPVIRKISFTGSTAIGKQLLMLAAAGVKRATMELGGHAPVIVFDDVDPAAAAKLAAASKFRNAGQVCTSPTRFFVQESVYPDFVAAFTREAKNLKVGDGLEPGVQMGPLANHRRIDAMNRLIADAVAAGAKLECGGERIANHGYFFAPTVLSGVPDSAAIMHEEPFGPVAPIAPFKNAADAIERANALPYGLAAYVMTRSLSRAAAAQNALEAGMVCLNHFTVSTPASPFGGVKESGYGSEGGAEGLDAYLVTKSLTQRVAGPDLEPGFAV